MHQSKIPPKAKFTDCDAKALKRSVYTCPELGKTCFRPGAYDAFNMPSRYMDSYTPYRPNWTPSQ